MHIKMPIILVMLIGLLYISQIHYFGGGWILQEADGNWGWLVRVLTIATVLTVLLILRTPKRMRLNAGFFMAIIGLFAAVGLYALTQRSLARRSTIRLLLWTATQMTRMWMMATS